MPTLRLTTAVPAGSVVTNAMAGSKFEQLPFPASVAIYQTASGTNITDGDVTCDVTMGNAIEGDQLSLPVVDAAVTGDNGPQRNRHLVASGVADAHDRIQIKLTNGDASNAAVVISLIEIRPV
ncbi:unnamed protein product [marine sediment metagenome]|uniref:Uncharacterized protein n=1 Tax=marine sediment metagenome TaxID=412755 RepID=X1V875_9ZZZZ